METKKLAIKLTGAIGDLVMTSALLPSLREQNYDISVVSKNFTLPLCKNLPYKATFGLEDVVPDDWSIIELTSFFSYMPYQNNIPAEFIGEEKPRIGHLSEWMCYELSKKTGLPIRSSADNVNIILDKDEVEFGKQTIHNLKQDSNNLPVVIIAPNASVKNKDLSRAQLEQIVTGLSDFVIPCLLEPLPENKRVERARCVGDKDLRKATAILYASDVYVGVDSGPFHMINAALQGTPHELGGNINTDPSKVVLLVGSSHPDAIKYKGNRSIWSKGGCEVSPCGSHGYATTEEYNRFFDKEFYSTEKDKSSCIFEDYNKIETAKCMNSISPDEVIETIKDILH